MLVSLKDNPVFSLTVPSKVQSYMACGKPIIASIRGEGARIIEQSGAGASVSPDDAEQLASKIEEFSRYNASELQAMGTKARQYYEYYFEKNKVCDLIEQKLQQYVICNTPGTF